MKNVGKMPTLHARISDRGVTVELDESAVKLILLEGFSLEYGARNLERVMDRLLGTLIADALLSGELIKGQIVRLKVTDGAILTWQA